MESALQYNPETGKPNPISIKEYSLMDRKEQRAFFRMLSRRERFDFAASYIVSFDRLPIATRREYARAKMEKLQNRSNASLGDKLEVAQMKLYLKHIELPAKPPIFFRKLRTRETSWPKWIAEKKSPFLIKSPQMI